MLLSQLRLRMTGNFLNKNWSEFCAEYSLQQEQKHEFDCALKNCPSLLQESSDDPLGKGTLAGKRELVGFVVKVQVFCNG